ncbi:MAG: hypothetical protein AAF355_02280 [Myxococcota bacterium]
MNLSQDARFREELRRFSLKFCCEDCALFDPRDASCVYGYPTADHRLLRYEDPDSSVVFCKDFELLE